MPARLDLTNQRFHRLTAIKDVGNDKHGMSVWSCRCDCGNSTLVSGSSLKRGHVKSCGCLRRDAIIASSTTHGFSRTPEFNTWTNIHQRCSNPHVPSYANYGGRGITVDPRWDDFEAFLTDMGERPTPRHSIERVNNDKGYGPSNCKWATRAEQNRNTTRTHTIHTPWGDLCLTDAAKRAGIARDTLMNRLNRGWDHHRAVTTPGRTAKRSDA